MSVMVSAKALEIAERECQQRIRDLQTRVIAMSDALADCRKQADLIASMIGGGTGYRHKLIACDAVAKLRGTLAAIGY